MRSKLITICVWLALYRPKARGLHITPTQDGNAWHIEALGNAKA